MALAYTLEKERMTMNSNRPRVFVTQEQSHINYEQAESFGDVVFVSESDIPTVSSSLRCANAIQRMTTIMDTYIPNVDFILPSGSPINIAAVMMLAGRSGDTHNILKWENRSCSYTRVALSLVCKNDK